MRNCISCGAGFEPNKFYPAQKYCSGKGSKCRKSPLPNKGKKHRLVEAKEAEKLGISKKMYLSNKYESNRWCYLIEVIRRRCKKSGIICNITPKVVRDMWHEQKGICPITGWEMIERKSGIGYSPFVVTVDRINSDIGYIKENVRLVCFMANNAKYTYSDKELINFCKSVIEYNT